MVISYALVQCIFVIQKNFLNQINLINNLKYDFLEKQSKNQIYITDIFVAQILSTRPADPAVKKRVIL